MSQYVCFIDDKKIKELSKRSYYSKDYSKDYNKECRLQQGVLAVGYHGIWGVIVLGRLAGADSQFNRQTDYLALVER